jgi:type IV secretion system protein VirB10
MSDVGTAGQVSTAAVMRDIKPIVARDAGNRPLWLGLATIALAGLGLFLLLNTGRQQRTAPAIRPSASELVFAPSSATSALYVPPAILPGDESVAQAARVTPGTVGTSVSQREIARTAPLQSPALPSTVRDTTSSPTWGATVDIPAPFEIPPAPATAVPLDLASAIIVDGGIVARISSESSASDGKVGAPADKSANGAAIAVRPPAQFASARALVVPQGTLISAVLETALDSTQPGQARALVSSDIRGIRSTRVLIPRGSRLFGSYQGDLAEGQNRVLVQWSRLVRPDGVTVSIDSPASDPLGRAGIKGRLRTHFWKRLGGALLQSFIDVGSIFAARGSYNSPILVAVPGRVSGVASELVGTAPKPSVTVPPGMQISVFAVRDLDFSNVEGLP